MKRPRLMPRLDSSFFGVSSPAAGVLLQLAAVVVLVRLPSFADGIECVQCGHRQAETCGQTLPPPTPCPYGEHRSCTMGAFVSKKTGAWEETRQCSTHNAQVTKMSSQDMDDGTLHEFYCGADGCNKDQSGRPPPPRRPTPPAIPQQCLPPEGVPFECVECGWTFGDPCGDQLPPATQCKDAKHKTCATGVHVTVNAGKVQEIRACVESNFGGLSDNRPIRGDTCKTAGCNGERHPSTPDPQECPPDGDVTDTTTDGDGNMSPDNGESPPPAGENSASSSRYSSSSPNQRLLCWMLAALSLLFGLVVFRFNAAASL